VAISPLALLPVTAEGRGQVKTEAELKAHAGQLSIFFSALFRERDTVRIFPKLSNSAKVRFRSNPESLPQSLYGKDLWYWDYDNSPLLKGKVVVGDAEIETEYKEPTRVPRDILDAFSRKPTSKNIQTLARLHHLNALGYDIFFCVNPLTCPSRMQATVRLARHVLAEMDHVPLDEQQRILSLYKDHISALTFSGRRSLHAYFRLSDMWNESALTWKDLQNKRHLKDLPDHGVPWPAYASVASCHITEIESHGCSVDDKAKDYSALARVPGFLHCISGKPCEVLSLNPDAYPMDLDADSVSVIDEEPALHIYSPPEPPATVEPPLASIKREEPDLIYVSAVPKVTEGRWLHELDDFNRLKTCGIPALGHRRKCHDCFFTAARVMGWDGEAMAREWASIIARVPGNTRESPEDAVKDMLCDFASRQSKTPLDIYLPDLTRLPRPGLQAVRKKLAAVNCPESVKVSAILRKVIVPKLRTLTVKCAAGIGIHAKDIQMAARGKYKEAFEWMQSRGIMVCTNDRYLAGVRTKQYRINIPLVIWLCGYRPAELDWKKAGRQIESCSWRHVA